MWRNTARRVSETVSEVSTGLQLPWQGEFAPLSVFHKRLTEAEQQQRAPNGTSVQQQGWILNKGNLNESLRPQDHANQAVQAAFAEWSRQSDPPALALAFDDQLEVLPLDLGPSAEQQPVGTHSSLLGAFWEQQDLQLLHSLPSDDAPAAAPAAAPEAAPPAVLQEQPLLWGGQDAARSASAPSTAAAAAQAPSPAAAAPAAYTANLPVDALIAAADRVLQNPGNYIQPMAVTAAGLPYGSTLQEPTLLPPEDAGMPSFGSPFAGFVGLHMGQAEPAHHLHAPNILPGYKLLAPLTGGSGRGTVSHAAHACSTTWGAAACPDSAAAATSAAAVANTVGLAPQAPADADAAMLQQQQGPEPLFVAPPAVAMEQQDLPAQPAEAPAAGPIYTSKVLPGAPTPAGSGNSMADASPLPGAFLQPLCQHTSPFQAMAPWELFAAAAEPVGVPVAEIAAAQEAARAAAAALPHGLWGMDVDAGPGGQGVQQGRVRKAPNGKKLHSSTKTKIQIKALMEQHEELLTQYQAEVSLNNILQQHWTEVSDAYDATLTRQLQRQATFPHGAAAVAAATAGGSQLAATSGPAATAASGPAATAAESPAGLQDDAGLDALAAAVQTSWTSTLSQLVDLLPVLAPCSSRTNCGAAAPPQHTAAEAAARPAGAVAGGQVQSQLTARELLGDDGLLSPFATPVGAAAANTAVEQHAGLQCGAGAAGQQNADAAALSVLSLPLGACLTSIRAPDDDDDEVSSPTGSNSSDHSTSSSGSHGVKRRRSVAAGAAGKEVCADLGLLLSASLSLHPPQAKHAKVDGVSGRLTLTESDMRLLFSSIPSDIPSLTPLQQQQLGVAGPLLQQQQAVGPLPPPQQLGQQPLQQLQGGVGNFGVSASVDAAQRSASTLVDSLWSLFQNVAMSGPALLYRCFGPRVAYCPCCCRRTPVCSTAAGLGAADAGQRSPCSMMALLLDETADGACMVGGCAGIVLAGDGSPAAAAQAATTSAAAVADMQFAQAVHASAEHWQRAREHLLLTPAQQEQLQMLWAGLQNAHAPFAARRQELVLGLQQQSWATGGMQGVAWFDTCFEGETAAAVTDDLLAGIDDSLAADYGVLLETCRLLWGSESPLTLLQKVKLLVASYPFWPDYTLLQCLTEGPSTGQARLQQPAATAAAVAGQS